MISFKYPAYKQGLMSREVEEAMTRHIGIFNTQTQSTQSSIDRDNPVQQVNRLKEDIKQYLVKCGRYEEEPRFVPNKFLEEAIGALRGLDNRTQRKWKKLLHQYGCLNPAGISQWEIL
jgi:hypothetical protein